MSDDPADPAVVHVGWPIRFEEVPLQITEYYEYLTFIQVLILDVLPFSLAEKTEVQMRIKSNFPFDCTPSPPLVHTVVVLSQGEGNTMERW